MFFNLQESDTNNFVSEVNDVILLKKTLSEIETPKVTKKADFHPPPVKSVKPGLCAVCGFQNEKTAKFCIKCGAEMS